MISNIFLDIYGQLRSGWRAALFIFGFVFCIAIAGTLFLPVIFRISAFDTGSALYMGVSALVSLLVALGLGWIYGKHLEGLPIRALGASFTNRWFSHAVLGAVVGTATIVVAIIISYAAGSIDFKINDVDGGGGIAKSMAISLTVFGIAAAFEEALFRGYVLQTLSRAGYAWIAIALTSLFFGALHMGNPNSNAISSINTMIAGVWFGIAYLKTRDLWFVWTLHLFWNWMQGSVFGIEVSGIKGVSTAPLLREVEKGPAWITGGEYGIEAGVACTIALVISMLAIYFMPGLRPDEELLRLTSPSSDQVDLA